MAKQPVDKINVRCKIISLDSIPASLSCEVLA